MWPFSDSSSGPGRPSEDAYEALPASYPDPSSYQPTRKPSRFRRRRTQAAIASFFCFLAAVALWVWLFFQGVVGIPSPILHALAKEDRLPPLYSRYHQYELELPQHHIDETSPEAQNVKYFWISNYVRGNGWGNVMQELLLDSYLAYRADRSFVFDNFTWKEGTADYTIYNMKPIPARIPLTALIQGPTVGAPYISEDGAPRAVMKEFWDRICPNPTVIKNDDVIAALGGGPTTSAMMVKTWVQLLRDTEDRCVEVSRDSFPIFDIWILQDADRLLEEWPAFSQSPILTEFRWSSLVELGFDVNRELFSPSPVTEPYLSSLPFVNGTSAGRYTQIPGLLAVHLRRGDFVRHCKRLSGWHANFIGYNAFPALPDQLNVPPDLDTPSRDEFYRVRCFPEIHEIVRKIEDVRNTEAGQGLQDIYIMTNGPADWVAALKAALRDSWQWRNIASSRDMIVNQEQEYVKQAVDMLIGQRAQVFIGNGFSSMTGQVTMLRMANNLPSESSRMW